MGWVTAIPIIDKVVGGITNYFENKAKIKQAEVDSALRINEAKTSAQEKRISEGQTADIAWENTSIAQSGWKDEYWTIVLSIPMVMCFVPCMVDYVYSGFEALEKTPTWYQWAVGIAIGSAFGVRRFTDFMRIKKGD